MNKLFPAVATAAFLVSSAALAQTAPTPTMPPSQAPAGRVAPIQTPPVLTEAEARALMDATVVSSDNKNIGEVAAIQRDGSGKVTELHADVGGFLGIGQSRIRLSPSQFTISNNRVLLNLTAEQVNELPKIEK